MSNQKDLEILMHGHTPLLVIESNEEERALNLLVKISVSMSMPVYKWAITEGLKRLDIDLGSQCHNSEPADVLAHIKSLTSDGIYVLLDYEPYIDDPKNTRFIKEIAMKFGNTRNKLVFLSHKIRMPSALNHAYSKFEMSLPSEKDLINLINSEAASWENQSGNTVTTDDRAVTRMVSNLMGLTFNDSKRLIRNAIVNDHAITEDDVSEVMEAKYKLLNRDNVITYEHDTTQFREVGGMDNLKKWLLQREKYFLNKNMLSNFDRPKGLLLLGVQGCGKSLSAKAIAGIWGVPLLRFDFSALYNKYIGESENNLRKSLKTAEVMAPCVLWIDEIEKGIAGGNDEGTSVRILGAFLTWLAENKSHVFVVATANNIDSLPPELIRKGRLDEVFFVDLPDVNIRKDIFNIHLEKRQISDKNINLDYLADLTEGFSGSEIEQVIVSALYASDNINADLTTDHIAQQVSATRPLSILMSDKINMLRDWAEGRTVRV